ncbi:MAG: sugar phosphate isomerase/epimerase family protein [Planctomycetota bacterium]|jgi:sugar phosphate isomerase/epimerase
MSGLAVSTTWNFERHGALAPAAREIADLGFAGVELRAQGSVPDRVAGGEACRALRLECRSVHTPLTETPWTDGDPSSGLASADEATRARAVAAVLDTLRTASAAGASVLIVHLGGVEMNGAFRRQWSWLEAVGGGDPLPDDAVAALDERRAKRDRHLDAAARSLFDLTRAEPGVTWALENRLGFHEIPDLDEVELLLADAPGENVAFWYDTGHAHLLGRVGGPDPLAWLDRYGDRTAGLHLHDVVGEEDHLPPGGGEVDWTGVRGYLSSDMIRVIEIHRRHSVTELVAGADYLRDLRIA